MFTVSNVYIFWSIDLWINWPLNYVADVCVCVCDTVRTIAIMIWMLNMFCIWPKVTIYKYMYINIYINFISSCEPLKAGISALNPYENMRAKNKNPDEMNGTQNRGPLKMCCVCHQSRSSCKHNSLESHVMWCDVWCDVETIFGKMRLNFQAILDHNFHWPYDACIKWFEQINMVPETLENLCALYSALSIA